MMSSSLCSSKSNRQQLTTRYKVNTSASYNIIGPHTQLSLLSRKVQKSFQYQITNHLTGMDLCLHSWCS